MDQLSGGSPKSVGDFAKFGIVTVSDRASSGTYEDLSGPAILRFFQECIHSEWEAVYKLVPDEQAQIEEAIVHLVGQMNLQAMEGTMAFGTYFTLADRIDNQSDNP